MSFLGNTELIETLRGNITDFDLKRIDAGKYELSLGDSYYSTDLKEFKVHHEPEESACPGSGPKSGQIVINPGQFALLITKETVTISPHHIGFISIKAGIKFKGLVNVSGFHVDPGFTGKLKFTVYNAGANQIHLTVGAAVFQLWLATITSETKYEGSHQGQQEISTTDLERMKGDVASPSQLKQEIEEIRTKEINALEHRLEKSIDELKFKNARNQQILLVLLGVFGPIAISVLIHFFPLPYLNKTEADTLINNKVNQLNLDSLVTSKV